MTTSEHRAKRAAHAISGIRQVKQTFTYEEGKALLKYAKCPYYQHMMALLIKENIIEKKDGLYEFTSKEPVFYGTLRRGIDEISKKVSGYCSASIKRKKGIVQSEDASIEEKIQFLKELGYKIFKEL